MSKKIALLFFLGFFSTLFSVGCNNKSETQVSGPTGQGPKPDPNAKPGSGTPPQFDPEQLKVGHWMTWKVTSKDGSTYCSRWTLETVSSSVAIIRRSESLDCITYQDDFYELLTFTIRDGIILSHQHVLLGNASEAPQQSENPKYQSLKGTSLNDRFYKNSQKVPFVTTTIKLLDSKENYPVFKLGTPARIYYLKPESEISHPWHATILEFEDQSGAKFKYQDSNPTLLPLPEE